jgi:exonuclease SbcC
VRPAVDDLSAAHDEARRVTGEARERAAREHGRCEALTASSGEVERLDAEIRDHEDAYAVIGRLAEVAEGDNRSRLSFQRYMLAAYLDDVLVVASQRLAQMTDGRYTLLRARGGDRRRALGLDLEVVDAFTGRSRNVSTLSGGESFQASLALALGLADVVQAYEGGLTLDTVFVDEGFGSLDPDNLSAALTTLMGLQTGGRLVGIISHVTELRDQIDARLEITSTRAGSSATFRVP